MSNAISIHIGLNRVNPDHYGSEMTLQGAVNDAVVMRRVAENAGFTDCTLLLDEDASSTRVRQEIEDAADELSSTGLFLLTYAGHGARLREDAAPGEGREPDGVDEAFCLFDRMMRDDEVLTLLARFGGEQRVFIVLDCCHSAGIPLVRESTPRGCAPGGLCAQDLSGSTIQRSGGDRPGAGRLR